MTSQFDDMFTEMARPVLAEMMGQSVTRKPASGSPVTVEGAIWTPDAPVFDRSTGKRIALSGKIVVSEDVTTLVTDKWEIDGTVYVTETIKDPKCGEKTVCLRRDNSGRTERAGGALK